MKYGLLIGVMSLVVTTACAPPTLYHWGDYEGSLYQLMKDPTRLNDYGVALNKQIIKAEASGKVPPGIYAEYGYFLVATQKHNEAVVWFQKERTKWPESSHLMDKMIQTCQKTKPADQNNTAEVKPAGKAVAGSVQ